jgi:hypothetical protein
LIAADENLAGFLGDLVGAIPDSAEIVERHYADNEGVFLSFLLGDYIVPWIDERWRQRGESDFDSLARRLNGVFDRHLTIGSSVAEAIREDFFDAIGTAEWSKWFVKK